jgi:hypothetical protein
MWGVVHVYMLGWTCSGTRRSHQLSLLVIICIFNLSIATIRQYCCYFPLLLRCCGHGSEFFQDSGLKVALIIWILTLSVLLINLLDFVCRLDCNPRYLRITPAWHLSNCSKRLENMMANIVVVLMITKISLSLITCLTSLLKTISGLPIYLQIVPTMIANWF